MSSLCTPELTKPHNNSHTAKHSSRVTYVYVGEAVWFRSPVSLSGSEVVGGRGEGAGLGKPINHEVGCYC